MEEDRQPRRKSAGDWCEEEVTPDSEQPGNTPSLKKRIDYKSSPIVSLTHLRALTSAGLSTDMTGSRCWGRVMRYSPTQVMYSEGESENSGMSAVSTED